MKPHLSLSFLERGGGGGTLQPVLGDGDICAEGAPWWLSDCAKKRKQKEASLSHKASKFIQPLECAKSCSNILFTLSD